MAIKGEGKTNQWIQVHLNYPHDDWCLIWPFARDKHGRGMMQHEGIHWWAHRYMCTLTKGGPPTPEHTAAHSCGNGHGGCINPHHLSWKTQAENLADCREHGTMVRTHGGNVRRILPEEVESIRQARGFQTQGQLAAKFGVSEGTISDIWHGRTHAGESKIKHYTPEEDAKIREGIAAGLNFTQITKLFPGRTVSGVMGYAYRIGLSSGQPVRKIYDPPKSAEQGSEHTNGERQ